MKVRVMVSIASPDWSYAPGQVVDMPDDQAETWCKSGLAEPVREAKAPETAMREAPEKAVQRTAKPRK